MVSLKRAINVPDVVYNASCHGVKSIQAVGKLKYPFKPKIVEICPP